MKRPMLPFGSGPFVNADEVTERGALWRWVLETEGPDHAPGRELDVLLGVADDVIEHRKAELRALCAQADPKEAAADPEVWRWTLPAIQQAVEAVSHAFECRPKNTDPRAAGEHTYHVEWPSGYWRAWVRHEWRHDLWRDEPPVEFTEAEPPALPFDPAPPPAQAAAAPDPLLPTVEEYASRIVGRAAAPGTCTLCGQAFPQDGLVFQIGGHAAAHYACVQPSRRKRPAEPSPIGVKVRQARKAIAGLTQKRLAKAIGCTEEHVSKSELGASEFTPDELAAIAVRLGLEVEVLTSPARELPGGLTWSDEVPQAKQDLLGVDFRDTPSQLFECEGGEEPDDDVGGEH